MKDINDINGSSIFFIDGGLTNNHENKGLKVPYSSIKEYHHDTAILNIPTIIHMVKECNIVEGIEVIDHMFMKQWAYRKTLQDAYNVEVFTALQVLNIIEKSDALNKNNKIIVALDNRALYNTLVGINASKLNKHNAFIRDVLRRLKILNSKYPLVAKRMLIKKVPRKDIELILGH